MPHTPRYVITIVVESDEDPSEILDTVHEELSNGFLDNIDTKILDEETAVEMVAGDRDGPGSALRGLVARGIILAR